jgi:segregation and condensation protein A
MSFGLAHDTRSYQLDVPVFTGPLDLLLQLIERDELDITALSIAQVTGHYIAHIQEIREKSPHELSAFLVIAARLVQIKSEALLPKPPVLEPGEEDAGEALARQLLIYKRYKEIANHLGNREKLGLQNYARGRQVSAIESKITLEGVTLSDFQRAAELVFSRIKDKASLDTIVAAPRVTIREKIRDIITTIQKRGKARFSTIVTGSSSRIEIVVSFLALLELVKIRRVMATQEVMFQEITIERSSNWDDSTEMELEFGE